MNTYYVYKLDNDNTYYVYKLDNDIVIVPYVSEELDIIMASKNIVKDSIQTICAHNKIDALLKLGTDKAQVLALLIEKLESDGIRALVDLDIKMSTEGVFIK